MVMNQQHFSQLRANFYSMEGCKSKRNVGSVRRRALRRYPGALRGVWKGSVRRGESYRRVPGSTYEQNVE